MKSTLKRELKVREIVEREAVEIRLQPPLIMPCFSQGALCLIGPASVPGGGIKAKECGPLGECYSLCNMPLSRDEESGFG